VALSELRTEEDNPAVEEGIAADVSAVHCNK